MPTSDLDLPLLPSAEQIRRREFATLRRGYDPDQVRDYLEAVAVQVETLEKDLKEARRQLEAKAAEPAVATPAAPAATPTIASPSGSQGCSPRRTARPVASSTKPRPKPTAW